MNHMPPAARAWGITLLWLGAGLAVYLLSAAAIAMLIGNAVLGAAASNVVILIAVIALRWFKPTLMGLDKHRPRLLELDKQVWIFAFLGVIVCWLTGQIASQLIKSTWGAGGFEAVQQAQSEVSATLLLLTLLILAPIGEESLMRGLTYPLLRRHWPIWASAFVTASVFALLHGNLMQIALTMPLGLLLAVVYEHTRSLGVVICMHMLFNLMSVFTTTALLEAVASPASLIMCAIALIMCFIGMPRPPAELSKTPAQHS